MDIYAEVTLIKVVNGRTYRLSIPWAAPFEELQGVISEFSAKGLEMQETAMLQAQQQADKGADNVVSE